MRRLPRPRRESPAPGGARLHPRAGGSTTNHRWRDWTGRHRVTAAIGVVVGVALIVAGAAALVGTRGGRATALDIERHPTHRTITAAGSAAGSAPIRPCRSPLTPDAPLRLWIAGDSLAYSVGNGLGKVAAATGVVAPVYESRVSSGLVSPGFFDWPQRIHDELTRLDPEVVVVVLGTNDWIAPGAHPPATGTPPTPTTTPEWAMRYAALVQGVVDEVARPDRTLVWLGPPVLRDPALEAGARAVAGVVQSVVTRNPDAVFVDGHDLLDAPDGSFASTLDVDGKKVALRTGDGIHLTPDGGDYVGAALFRLIDEQCRLRSQSVANSKQVVVETEGSNSVSSPAAAVAPTTTAPAAPSTTTPPTTAPAPTVPSTNGAVLPTTTSVAVTPTPAR